MKRQITALVFQEKAFDTIEEMNKRENIPFKVQTLDDDLATFYKIIGCDYVEITSRCIGGKQYLIICDETGRYVDEPVFTVINQNGSYLDIAGTIIITGPSDGHGDLTSLSQQDVANIVSHINITAQTIGDKEKYVPVIVHKSL